jgi:Lysylphosphatidylglycerol synthase TM region
MKAPACAYTLIAGLAGLAAMAMSVADESYRTILQMLGQAGWGLLWIVPVSPSASDSRCGRLANAAPTRSGRLRDPAVSGLDRGCARGGQSPAAGRQRRWRNRRNTAGVLRRPPAVAASVIVEVLLTTINQILFTAIGLALLVTTVKNTPVLDTLFVGLAVSAPAPIALALLLRYGSPFTRVALFAERMLGKRYGLAALVGGAATLDEKNRQLCRRRGRLWSALAWQLAGMLVGSFETWLVLDLFGRSTTALNAIALESLCLTIRHLVFFIPGALGVQETGLILIGALIGLPADAAIALSLAKRFREISIGLPALASWHWVEIGRIQRKLRRRRSSATTALSTASKSPTDQRLPVRSQKLEEEHFLLSECASTDSSV